MAIFSLQELDLAGDPTWALIKSRVMEKVVEQMREIEQALKIQLKNSTFSFPEGTKLKAGKISKGENYKGLPYVVLDYPALFSKEDIFSYRIMFLWGHHVSYSLHLQGKSLGLYEDAILKNYTTILSEQTRFYTHENPWEHFNNEYFYTDLLTAEAAYIEDIIKQHEFLKISIFEPIDSIERSPELACLYLENFLSVLS